MIEKCCICHGGIRGGGVIVKLSLPFRDILGKPANSIWNNEIAICRNCGFIFQKNPFSAEELEDRYKKFSKFEFDAEIQMPSDKSDYIKRCVRQKHFIEENIGNDFSSVFEIGAASGYNLGLYAKEKSVYGIEPSELNCRLAMQFYGVEMYNGMLQDFMKNHASHKKYDLIFMSMVLEHIVNPYEVISLCTDICNKYFFIEVPTLDFKYVDEPFGMICDEHVNLFTLESLSALMNKAGFELVNAEIIFDNAARLPAGFPAIATIWKKSAKIPRKLKYTVSSEEILDLYITANKKQLEKVDKKIATIPNDEKLALWGMGHHVSMLLANTSLAKKNLVRMYDSDKRKHGKTVMGIPISPFDMADIENGDIDSILITSYVAQNAIKKFALEKCPNAKIYTLYEI